jgi:hypothetical protein
MGSVKIASGKGFNRADAFGTQASYDVKFDATIAWKKAGSPVGKDFKEFAEGYLTKKVKNVAGIGFAVVVAPGVEDNRERPYTADIVTTEGKRKYKTVYQVFDTQDKFLGQKDKKSESLKLAKKLVTTNHTDVVIKVAKVVTEGQPTAATVKYTPSINAKEGSYIFFGIETE